MKARKYGLDYGSGIALQDDKDKDNKADEQQAAAAATSNRQQKSWFAVRVVKLAMQGEQTESASSMHVANPKTTEGHN